MPRAHPAVLAALVAPALFAPSLAAEPPRPDAAVSAPAAAPVDPNAAAVLRRVERRLKTLRSLHARYERIARWPNRTDNTPALREVTAARLAKPNLARVRIEGYKAGPAGGWESEGGGFTYAADGKAEYRLNEDKRTYSTRHGTKNTVAGLSWLLPLRGFFTPDSGPATMFANRSRMGDRCELSHQGRQTREGAEYEVVRMHFESPSGERLGKTIDLWVGADDLIHRWLESPPPGDTVYETAEWILREVKVNPVAAPGEFAYTPPKDAKPYRTPASELPLVAGTPAPDFSVRGRDGNPLKLSDFKGRVVVLDFWATWCGPCLASFPHTASLAEKYKDKGVVVLALNVWDEQAAFDAWLPKNPRYGGFVFAIDPREGGQNIARKQYNVRGIPTRYVIGRDGRVLASEVGFDARSKVLESAILRGVAPGR